MLSIRINQYLSLKITLKKKSNDKLSIPNYRGLIVKNNVTKKSLMKMLSKTIYSGLIVKINVTKKCQQINYQYQITLD